MVSAWKEQYDHRHDRDGVNDAPALRTADIERNNERMYQRMSLIWSFRMIISPYRKRWKRAQDIRQHKKGDTVLKSANLSEVLALSQAHC